MRYGFLGEQRVDGVLPELPQRVDPLQLVLGDVGDGGFVFPFEDAFGVDQFFLEDVEVGFLFLVGKQILG